MTDIDFDQDESNLLNKAVKYNINLDYKSKIVEDELIDVEVAIKNQPKEIQDAIRHNFVHELNKTSIGIRQNQITHNGRKELKLAQSIGTKLKKIML